MLEKKLEEAEKILKKYYGYSNFRQGQDKIIKNILSGNDTFAIMPTGAGKSICFQIPAMLFDGLTLVISPLISLMKNQVDALSNLGLPASFINSSLSFPEVKDRIYRAKKGLYKLLYIAPERFDNNYFRDLLKFLSISLLVVDEAHCISHWGHDFRPSYLSIGPFIGELPARPVISAFTATATENVREDIIKLLGLRDGTLYITGFNRKNLFFSVMRG
ncbi:MAG: RecQ family ATP-dependent DNA helicase, partial [Candidatus Eremiobacterota bacterium]